MISCIARSITFFACGTDVRRLAFAVTMMESVAQKFGAVSTAGERPVGTRQANVRGASYSEKAALGANGCAPGSSLSLRCTPRVRASRRTTQL